jgi:hypothetical protein
MFVYDFQCSCAGVARVSTQMFAAPLGRQYPLDHDGIQYRLQLRDIMPVRPGHDER